MVSMSAPWKLGHSAYAHSAYSACSGDSAMQSTRGFWKMLQECCVRMQHTFCGVIELQIGGRRAMDNAIATGMHLHVFLTQY